jgi:hypothetical protein
MNANDLGKPFWFRFGGLLLWGFHVNPCKEHDVKGLEKGTGVGERQ